MEKGNSIENAILIESQNYMTGVIEEHNHIDEICRTLNCGIKAISQNFIIEDGRKYDLFTLEMDDGSERTVCFDITSFFVS